MMMRWLPLAALVVIASPVWAAKEPKLIAWPDLMPQAEQPVMPEDLDFGGDDLSEDQTYDPDLGGVVEHGMTPAPDLADTTNVVEELNDVQVKIAGYVL
ncbi:MAG: hypothetical protein ACR2RA_26965, partial [Geminicoccaceae bacterium]